MTAGQVELPLDLEQARRLRKAKRRMQLRGVTAVPTKPATVLQFPDKKEVADAHPINEA